MKPLVRRRPKNYPFDFQKTFAVSICAFFVFHLYWRPSWGIMKKSSRSCKIYPCSKHWKKWPQFWKTLLLPGQDKRAASKCCAECKKISNRNVPCTIKETGENSKFTSSLLNWKRFSMTKINSTEHNVVWEAKSAIQNYTSVIKESDSLLWKKFRTVFFWANKLLINRN